MKGNFLEKKSEAIKALNNKFDMCVSLLNGMAVKECKSKYGYQLPSKITKRLCREINERAYAMLVGKDDWICINGEVVGFYRHPTIKELREFKHLFIGDL